MDDHSASTSQSITSSLLHGLRVSDSMAWSRVDVLFRSDMSAWFRNWGVPASDVGDLVQEVFLSLTKHIDKFHRSTPHATFRGWLWTIARNKARDYFAGRHPVQLNAEMLAELDEQSDTVEPTPEEQERAGWVHCVLDIIRSDFEDSTFQCFWRYYVDEEDPAIIAADLGMKPATRGRREIAL